MKKIWSEEERFKKMFDVELLACESLSKEGLIPGGVLNDIKRKAKIDVDRIQEIEAVVKHDVIAFLEQIEERVGANAKYLHFGMTSSDVLDTVTALQLKESSVLIIKRLKKLAGTIKKLAVKYKTTPMVGRTHGIHAEPTTFGLKLASWYSEINRHIKMMRETSGIVPYGQVSGAVGNFAHLSPSTEEYVCRKLGLKFEPVSTQIIPRDRHAVYLSSLAIIACSLERFATEIRHLQRNEVNEVQEPFGSGQKGSSAMPHKRNPVLCENICGLARMMRSYLQVGLENISLWHERDISHSSAERIVLPDSSILIDFMLERMTRVIDGMKVYPQNMLRNLNSSRGLVFSERILLALVKKGVSRKGAYKLVQRCAFDAANKKVHFKEVLLIDKDIRKYLSGKEIEDCFKLDNFSGNVNKIFRRIF
jgi:adenylosuccinate lyase